MLCCMIDLKKIMDDKSKTYRKCKSHVTKNYMPKMVWRRRLRQHTVEPLPWKTSIRGTRSPFRGHLIWSWKNAFVFISPFEGAPLFRGKGHFFWVPKPGFNLLSGDTIALKKWLTTKGIDIFKYGAFTYWTIWLKSMYCTCVNSSLFCHRDKLKIIFFMLSLLVDY